MAVSKIVGDLADAVEGVDDGATVMVSGFGGAGAPDALLDELARRRPRNLTVVANNAGAGRTGLAALLAGGCVRKVVCSYPRMPGSVVFDDLYNRGEIELELVPQGTLSERIRAGGAGIGGFYTRTAVGTALGEDREQRTIDGEVYLFEKALRADFAFIRAARGDRWGNVVYRKAARNFGPTMAMAAATTIVEVGEVVELGALDPEAIVTPGIFVQRVVEVP